MTSKDEFWLDRNRFAVVIAVVLLIWGSMFTFLYLKYDEITKHPCTLCAEKVGNGILCTTQSLDAETKLFLPNGSVWSGLD